MGFFSSIGGFIRNTGEKIKEKIEKTKEKIEEAISLFGLKKDEVAKRTSEQNAYDEEAATIAETKRINSILSEFSLNLSEQADELEEEVIESSGEYFNKLIEFIEKNNVEIKINTSRLKSNKIKIEKEIRGSFKKHLSKRVSIDDPECLMILKMDAGETKKKRMKKFGDKVIKEAANNLCLDIKESLLEQGEYIEDSIKDKIDEKINIQSERKRALEEIEKSYSLGKGKIDGKKSELLYKISICNLLLDNITK